VQPAFWRQSQSSRGKRAPQLVAFVFREGFGDEEVDVREESNPDGAGGIVYRKILGRAGGYCAANGE
jgi:hypothetical protein